MKILTRLYDPAPTDGGSPTPPASTIPTVSAPSSVVVPASKIFDSPSSDMQSILDRNKRNLPQNVPLPKPAEPKPAAPVTPPKPAEPAPTPAPAAPPAPVAPAKIKVGKDEFTPEELEKIIAGHKAPPPAPAPAPEPPKPAAPTPEAPKPPTPEEIAKQEDAWIAKQAASYRGAQFSDEEMEVVLSGGKEGRELLNKKLAESAARAHLDARKTLYEDFENRFEQQEQRFAQLAQHLTPVLQNHQEIQIYETQQAFLKKHPDFQPHLKTARHVADELLRQYPEQCSKMSQEQFMDEVAKQTDGILSEEFKRWNPDPNANWRTFGKQPPTPAAAAPAPAPEPAKTVPPVPPPGSTPPASAPGRPAANWNKTVAESLRE